MKTRMSKGAETMQTHGFREGRVLRLDPRDNVLVALTELAEGEIVSLPGEHYRLLSAIPAKHKFVTQDLAAGGEIIMYGVLVGQAQENLRRGELLSTRNIRHATAAFHDREETFRWTPPDVSAWRARTFLGYPRADGQVGTRNYWLVLPLVFCENRNLNVLKQAFEEELGFAAPQVYRRQVAELARLYRDGQTEKLKTISFSETQQLKSLPRVFQNIDGIKFLIHEGGCGGTREDARNLCALLAGYIHHPNVAGATILSLGCQNAQVAILQEEINRRDANFSKPLLIFEQQKCPSEAVMLSRAIRETFLALIEAEKADRRPARLSSLTLGLKCGGSDGFSGLSVNPAIGHTADLVAALGGRTILSEFPELCGVEQQLIDRCVNEDVAARFVQLMSDYAAQAKAVRSGFEMNPSPGNIRDGLLTDAMKSAGAAKKGGTSPVTAVLDYPEYSVEPGLNLQCTPGNDVECVTAQVGAGANVVLFTTGLGTPTGNPIAPVLKLSSNSDLALRMSDIIDIDAGGIISAETSIAQMGEIILERVVQVASGEHRTKAEILGQDDFIPWKRGVSL
jgi:altronate hydrolase